MTPRRRTDTRKNRRSSRTTVLFPRTAMFALGALAAAALASAAHAQDAVASLDAEGPRPAVWIERNITVGQTLSSNGTLSGGNARNEQTTEVSPGIRAVFNTPRAQGFIDYSLRALFYAQGNSRNQLRNRLNARATLNGWDQRAFVDLSGVVTDQAVSAFGPQELNGLSDNNRAQTASFRFSPYLRGSVAREVDYELRYALATVNTDTVTRSNVVDQSGLVRLGSRDTGQTLGWSLNASSGITEYSRGRDTESSSAQGAVIIAPTSQLRVSLLAGVEANDIITLETETYNTAGINVDWRPSSNTRVYVGVEERYFGTGHNISLTHRTGRTVWSYTDTRGVVNNAFQDGAVAQPTAYSAFYELGSAISSDPVAVARFVDEQLRLFGYDPNAFVFLDFLASSASLDHVQRLSVALLGIRSVWTLSAFSRNSTRLDIADTASDDFDLNNNIDLQGWNLNYAHRLTPLTALNASFTNQTSRGSSGASSTSTTVSVRLNTLLSRRTTGSVQLQRGNYSNSAGSYGNTAISGFITHRF